MVTGSTPFEGESPYVIMNARVTGDPPAPRKLNLEMSPALEEVILHALERDPRQRYASAAEMKRELDNLDSVTITHRDQRLRAPQPWASRRHMWIMMAGMIIALIALFLLLLLLLPKRH
jgi:serine/threonine-protein kinase